MLPWSDRQVATLLGVAVAGLALALAGWWLVRPAAAPVEATVPMAGASPSAASANADPPAGDEAPGASAPEAGAPAGAQEGSDADVSLVVQAAGAVRSPGVHRLPSGARVDDLVRAAGGFAEGADTDRVNLAAPLVDGERVWVPAIGEEVVPEVVAGGGGSGGAGPSATGGAGGAGDVGRSSPAGPVDLNRASAAELDTLPGIGPATAAAILAHREEIGRFSSVEQLLDVRGIGDAKLEQLRSLVTV